MNKKESLKQFLLENTTPPTEPLTSKHRYSKTYRKVGSTVQLMQLPPSNIITQRKQKNETPQINLKTNLLTVEFAQHIKALTPVKPISMWPKR